MLAKKFRLQIQSVLNKSGRNIGNRYFLLKLFPGSVNYNRFGAVISKKVHKSAVWRNRLKRIIMDVAGKFIDAGDRNGQEVLIIVSPAMTKLKKADIIKEIDESLRKIL
ncbi:MAG: ribonuclease P protein component [Patescibacteria group bacterium]|nr:ribonuclease P protein component [Patescibacteria group bacterium]